MNKNRNIMASEPYFVFREEGRVFQEIGIYTETDTDRDVNVTSFLEPERVHALQVSDGVLALLGIPAMLGRVFSKADDSPSAAPTVILTYSYWQRKFAANSSVIGQSLIVDGVSRNIIGVMPREFRFLDSQNLALILPLQLERNPTFQGNFSYFGVARLKEETTLVQAGADVARMLPIMYREFPPASGMAANVFERLRLSPALAPLKQEVIGNVTMVLWVLMAAVGTVLLIACANVANLLLVRTAGREQELTLRAAIGASRSRIAAQLLCENSVLGLLGAAMGLALSWAALCILVRFAPAGLPRVADIAIDARALLFTLVTALLTSLLFGLIAVFGHASISAGIPSSARNLTGSRQHYRVQATLVAWQVALALVLLVCSGLMIRTFFLLSRVNPGYVPAGVETFRVSISSSDLSENEAVVRLEQRILDKISAIGDVSSVAFGSSVPMDGNRAPQDNVVAADLENQEQPVPPIRRDMFVSPGYFQTLRIRLLAGRDFSWTETYNKAPVALISESFAREYWQTPSDALGKRIRPGWSPEWREIVGVVEDVRTEAVQTPPSSTVYWPVFANARSGTRVSRFVTFAVRSPLAGSDDLVMQLRQAVSSCMSTVPLASVETLNYFLTRSMARTSFTLVMLALAGGTALLLGTVGLYGAISYSVSRRTREIGVRMALGAQPKDVLTLIVVRAMAIVFAGLTLGVAASLVLIRLMSSMLYGVRSGDPLTYMLVVLLLGTVTLGACYLPARRAVRLGPMLALRHE
jgi:predicted permease